jgi:dihydrofolate synthase/folylpolyglutamate synthase
MNYSQSLQLLNSFDNFEKKLKPSKNRFLNLDRIKAALQSLENPEKQFKTVLVGGTNGKGSTAFYLSEALIASGYKVGLYTSPHLVDVRERIAVDGKIVSKHSFTVLVKGLKNHIQKNPIPRKLGRLTYFEFMTLMSLIYFKQKKAEIVVLEVGLGGRLDATNAVSSCLTLLTPISKDHTHILGNTLTKIAREKAYLIAKGGTAISTRQPQEVSRILRKRAKQVGAKLFFEAKDFTFPSQGREVQPNFLLQNQSLAFAALKYLKEKKSFKKVSLLKAKRTFRSKRWPGRFDLVGRKPKVILDGVHNPAGAKAFTDAVNSIYPNIPKVIIAALAEDKDLPGIIKEFKRLKPTKVITTCFHGVRSFSPEVLKEKMDNSFKRVESAASLKKAYSHACQETGGRGMILITGSLYLVGEARKMLVPNA